MIEPSQLYVKMQALETTLVFNDGIQKLIENYYELKADAKEVFMDFIIVLIKHELV